MALKKQHYGFTLIELLATIVIMGIISVVIGKFLLQEYKIAISAQNITEVDWQGFIALERIVNDVQSIRSPTDISTMLSSQLTFVNISGTTVQYQLSGGNLLRNSQILASGVQSISFSYRDDNGTVTAVPSAMRYVSISITLVKNEISTTFATSAGTRGMP